MQKLPPFSWILLRNEGKNRPGRVDGVVLDSGELISAGVVVVATAGWSGELLQKSVGLTIPTLRLHATAGRTEPLDVSLQVKHNK